MAKYRTNSLVIIVLLLIGSINALSCNCEGETTVAGSLKYSDVVLSGKVISRTLTNRYDSLGVVVTGDTSNTDFRWYNYPIAVVKIKVDKIYKGQLVSDTISILTPPNGAGCGYDFQVGQNYIVYATLFNDLLTTEELKMRTFDNKTFWTHLCTRAQNWNITEENELIKAAKQGKH